MKEIIQGTEVHYCIEGEGHSNLLLLHGWGCDLSMMKPVAEAFSQTHRVLLVDFPGHGQSGKPPMPWGVPEYADCLVELLHRTGFEPCSVIAHSFGCRVAAWIEATRHGYFSAMILTGAAGIRPRPTKESARRSREYARLKTFSESIGRIPLLANVSDRMKEALRHKYGSRDYNALDEEMRKTFVKVINLDLSDLYAQFRASTLLIWGDADTETPLWMGQEMEKRIPDAGLVIFEGGTHFAYLEQLPRFLSVARFFLKEEES